MPNAQQYLDLIHSSPNLQKFLQTIGWAEGANYNIGWGGRLIGDLSWHPYNVGQFRLADGRTTSAAGKYQFERKTWEGAARALGLQNFQPQAQDIAAVYLIDKAGALNDVVNGNATTAVQKLRGVWEGFKTRPLQNVVNYFNGVSGGLGGSGGISRGSSTTSSVDDFSKYLGVSVIGEKNRYLIAFTILVIILIFAFN